MNDTAIYLDNQATTPLDPRVLEAMLPFLKDEFGNASSRHHAYGQRAHDAVNKARQQVADLIGCNADEIVFTSGATESNNLALRGVMTKNRERGRHLVTSAIEHNAVLDVAMGLREEGIETEVLPVLPDGCLALETLADSLRSDTVLLSVMAANNEIGTLQPLADFGRLCREKGVLFHTDAAQAAGKIPIDVNKMTIDLLSLSGHKMYGPKGIGALYVRRRNPRVRLAPQNLGGGQERGLRSGTLNTPGIVGLGEACCLAKADLLEESCRLLNLRTQLLTALRNRIPGIQVNGNLTNRLPGNLNVEIPGVDSEALLHSLQRIAISNGSACTAHTIESSHVLRALGLTAEHSLQCIRIGLGRFNTAADVAVAAEEIADAAARIRALSGWA